MKTNSTPSAKRYIEIANLGEISREAIELFGYSDKRDISGMIGEKGTGLKFSRFQALRKGIDFFVCTSQFKNWISDQKVDDKNNRIVFNYENTKGKKEKVKSSYTAMAGFGDWTKDWYIFREVVQNARDETFRSGLESESHSMKFVLDNIRIVDQVSFAKKGNTNIYILLTQDMEKIFENLNHFFCSDQVGIIESNKKGDARIFKQGIFVHQYSNAKAFCDYNLEKLSLTESRDIKNTWEVAEETHEVLNIASIQKKREFMRYASRNHEGIEFLSFANSRFRGDDWKKAFYEEYPKNSIIHDSDSISEYQSEKLKASDLILVSMPKHLYGHLRTLGIPTFDDLAQKQGKESFDIVKLPAEKQEILTQAIQLASKALPWEKQVHAFKAHDAEDRKTQGLYVKKSHDILINFDCINSVEQVLPILIEELIHAHSGAQDHTRDFQNVCCNLIAALVSSKTAQSIAEQISQMQVSETSSNLPF